MAVPTHVADVDTLLTWLGRRKPGASPLFDRERVRVTIKEKRDAKKSAEHGVVVELCEVLNQDDKVVLACEHLLMIKRRETC